jgi:hypothetical protein
VPKESNEAYWTHGQKTTPSNDQTIGTTQNDDQRGGVTRGSSADLPTTPSTSTGCGEISLPSQHPCCLATRTRRPQCSRALCEALTAHLRTCTWKAQCWEHSLQSALCKALSARFAYLCTQKAQCWEHSIDSVLCKAPSARFAYLCTQKA